MKKAAVLIAVVGLLCTSRIFAQELKNAEIQVGIYNSFNFAHGGVLAEEKTGDFTTGLDLFYKFPVKSDVVAWGFSGAVEFGNPIGFMDYIDSWYVVNATAGIFGDLRLNPYLKLRTGVDYGIALNMAQSKARNVSGVQPDQLFRAGVTFFMEPDLRLMKNMALYWGLNYQLMPEIDNLGRFWGIKVGLLYRFKLSNSTKNAQ